MCATATVSSCRTRGRESYEQGDAAHYESHSRVAQRGRKEGRRCGEPGCEHYHAESGIHELARPSSTYAQSVVATARPRAWPGPARFRALSHIEKLPMATTAPIAGARATV